MMARGRSRGDAIVKGAAWLGIGLGVLLLIVAFVLIIPFLGADVIVHIWPQYAHQFWWIVLGLFVLICIFGGSARR